MPESNGTDNGPRVGRNVSDVRWTARIERKYVTKLSASGSPPSRKKPLFSLSLSLALSLSAIIRGASEKSGQSGWAGKTDRVAAEWIRR